LKIQKSYLFMGLAVLGIVLFFVLGGPQALRISLLDLDKETIVVPSNDPLNPGRTLEIVTLLPRDGIQAILNPQFITPAEADRYTADEPALAFLSTGTAVLTPSRF
jgi:hypothetical protein